MDGVARIYKKRWVNHIIISRGADSKDGGRKKEAQREEKER